MQIFGAVLGLFLGPRGCLGLLFFVAVEILVDVRYGDRAAAWATLAMLVFALLPIGMRNGRAGLMRAFQAVLAIGGAMSAVGAFIGFMSAGFADGRAWSSVLGAGLCYLGFRGLERLIARTDAASASAAGPTSS